MHSTLKVLAIATLVVACSGKSKTKSGAEDPPRGDIATAKPPVTKKARWSNVASDAKGAVQKTLAAAYKVTPDQIRVAPLAPHPPAHWPQGPRGPWKPLVADKKGAPQLRAFATDSGQVFLRLTHPNGLSGFLRSRIADGAAKADPAGLARDIVWIYERVGGGIIYPRHAHGAKLVDPPATFQTTGDGTAVLRFRLEWAGATGSTGEYDVELRNPPGRPTIIKGRAATSKPAK